MIAFDLGGPEMIILLVLVLVLFGGTQLPKLARNLGKAQKEFKDGLSEGQRNANATDTTATTAPSTSPAAPSTSAPRADAPTQPRSTELTDG